MVERHYVHWVATNILRYLHGAINYGLRYIVENLRLHGYSNVDWVGHMVDIKITYRCFFSLGYVEISWMS